MGLLRTLLALAVCIIHAGGISGYTPIDGDVAVQGFYVVSGFYIAMVFNEKYAGFRNAASVFWINRYLRLAPTYAIVSLVAYLTIGRFALGGLDAIDRAFVLMSQFTMVGQDVFMFLGYDPGTGSWLFAKDFRALSPAEIPAYRFMFIPQGWSIGVELWFYALAPLLVRRSVTTIAAIVGACLVLRLVSCALFGLDGDPWSYRFFPFELGTFLLGVLSYRAWRSRSAGTTSSGRGHLILAGLLAAVAAYHYLPIAVAEKRWLFLLILAASLPDIFETTKRSALDRWIGDLSYPLYIVHMLCFTLLADLVAGPWKTPLLVAAAAGCAVLLAAIVERPGDRLRQTFTRRRRRRLQAPWQPAPA